MELPAGRVADVLDAWPIARLATEGPDGPQQVPVVFARVGDRIWSPIDGKPKRGGELARVRNVRARPRVSLLIDAYSDDWSQLWWVRVEGVAEVVEREAPEAVAALCRKYRQYDAIDVQPGAPQLLAIASTRISSWCAGPHALSALEEEGTLREKGEG